MLKAYGSNFGNEERMATLFITKQSIVVASGIEALIINNLELINNGTRNYFKRFRE